MSLPPVDLDALAAPLRGVAGIILHDVESSDEIAYQPDERFVAASLIKLPVLWHFFAECSAGRLDPDEQYTLAAADRVPGFGVLRSLHPGLTVRLRDLASWMITISDNTATNLLINRLGIAAVNATIARLGMDGTVLMRKMYDLRDPALNNYTTPRDMVRFYRQLLGGAGIAPQFQEEMLRSLHGQMARNKLPSGLPREIVLAHKTGDMTAIEHDAGIFFGSRRRVIAVVMSKDLVCNVEGVALCRRVGEIGWAWAQGAPMPAVE